MIQAEATSLPLAQFQSYSSPSFGLHIEHLGEKVYKLCLPLCNCLTHTQILPTKATSKLSLQAWHKPFEANLVEKYDVKLSHWLLPLS